MANKRYKAEWIKPARASEEGNFRITDTQGDNRVATCFLKENADLVTRALNFTDAMDSITETTSKKNKNDTGRRAKISQRKGR